jgi:hypothetical protein
MFNYERLRRQRNVRLPTDPADTAQIEQMIGAWQGGDSLGKVEDYRLAARGLDALGTFNAYLTDRTQSPERVVEALLGADAGSEARARIEAIARPPTGAPVLEPYVLVGAGVGLDRDGEPFTGLVLVHTSEQAARDNARILPRRVKETRSVLRADRDWLSEKGSVEVRVEGRVLLVTLKRPNVYGAQFLHTGDPLLLHR